MLHIIVITAEVYAALSLVTCVLFVVIGYRWQQGRRTSADQQQRVHDCIHYQPCNDKVINHE